eukprot:422802_1
MALRIFNGQQLIKRCHIYPKQKLMHINKRNISFLEGLNSKPTMFLFAFGFACVAAKGLHSSIYGSYRDRKLVETKEQLTEASKNVIEYYNSGDGHEKYENWNTKRKQKKQDKRQERKEKMKENISEAIKVYKDTKHQIKQDQK